MQLDATKKGLITGAAMIIVSLLIYTYLRNFDNSLQYIVYLIYAVGIFWSINGFKKQQEEPVKFGQLFSQGFKCFIVVTLIMVLFTFVFMQMHPELKEQMSIAYKAELIKQGNYTPNEMTTMVAKAKENYVVMLVSMAIFGYLIIGAVATTISSVILMKRN